MGSGTYSVPGSREAMRIGDPESLQNLLSAPDSSVVDISPFPYHRPFTAVKENYH